MQYQEEEDAIEEDVYTFQKGYCGNLLWRLIWTRLRGLLVSKGKDRKWKQAQRASYDRLYNHTSWMTPSCTDIKQTIPDEPVMTCLFILSTSPLQQHLSLWACTHIHQHVAWYESHAADRQHKKTNVKHKTVHTQPTHLTFNSVSWGQTCKATCVQAKIPHPSAHAFKLPLMKLVQLHNTPFFWTDSGTEQGRSKASKGKKNRKQWVSVIEVVNTVCQHNRTSKPEHRQRTRCPSYPQVTQGFCWLHVHSRTALLRVCSIVHQHPPTAFQHAAPSQTRFCGNYRILRDGGLWKPLICWLQAKEIFLGF